MVADCGSSQAGIRSRSSRRSCLTDPTSPAIDLAVRACCAASSRSPTARWMMARSQCRLAAAGRNVLSIPARATVRLSSAGRAVCPADAPPRPVALPSADRAGAALAIVPTTDPDVFARTVAAMVLGMDTRAPAPTATGGRCVRRRTRCCRTRAGRNCTPRSTAASPPTPCGSGCGPTSSGPCRRRRGRGSRQPVAAAAPTAGGRPGFDQSRPRSSAFFAPNSSSVSTPASRSSARRDGEASASWLSFPLVNAGAATSGTPSR